MKILIYVLFLLSGMSSLIYEVLWMRDLGLIFGNTTYATGTVLAAFMGGLGLGAYFLGKFFNNTKNPVKIYAVLEIIIAIYILFSPVIFKLCTPLYSYFYNNLSNNFFLLTFLRLTISFIILLIPTFLMGGTLPLLGKYFIDNLGQASSKFGVLYSINTVGACLGSTFCTFLFLGSIGVDNTRYVAITINLLVGFIGLYVSKFLKEKTLTPNQINSHKDTSVSFLKTESMLLALFFISGFTSFGYEVIWTRLFIPFLGTSIYSFTLILLAVLIGIALGSFLYKYFQKRIKDSLIIFGILELIIAMISIFNIKICGWLDDFYFYLINQNIVTSWIVSKLIIIGLIFLFLAPVTIIFGFIFPLFSNIILKKLKNVGSDIGKLYAVNTSGNIVGSIFCGFISIQFFGLINTLVILSLLNFFIGIFILIKYYLFSSNKRKLIFGKLIFSGTVCFLFLGCLIFSYQNFKNDKEKFYSIFPGKLKGIYPWDTKIYYYKEDVDATITAYRNTKNNRKGLLVNGVGITVLVDDTKLLAHLPIWIHGNPKNFLNICFGMGTTFASTLPYKNLQVDAVEIIKSVYETFKYFHPNSASFLKSKRTNAYYGDGVNYLKLTDKKYDIISLDPAPPLYAFGTVHLYSKDFYELCEKRLKDDGIMCQWICYGGISLNTYKMLLKTFSLVWENVTVINSPNNIGTYVIGSHKKIDYKNLDINKYLKNKDVVKDLTQLHSWEPSEKYYKKLYLFKNESVKKFVEGAKVLTEKYPYLEFPLNNYKEIKNNVSHKDLLEFKKNFVKN